MNSANLIKTILGYGLALAAGVLFLRTLEVQFLARSHPLEVYAGLLAIVFMALGVAVGARLFRRGSPPAPFEPNVKALQALGISEREFEVLQLLCEGGSNKEIAARLHLSPNTVKTHVANLYGKLSVRRRTEAVLKARALGLVL